MMAFRPALLGGIALITAGTLLLLRNLGVLPTIPVGPLVLIAVGVAVLSVSRPSGSSHEAQETAGLSLEGATSARLVLNHGAGLLTVTAGASDGQLFTGAFTGGVVQHVQRRDGHIEVTLQPPHNGQWLSRGERLRWDVALTAGVPLDLEVRTGASRVQADLAETAVRSLALKTGASDVDLTVPRHGHSRVTVSAGAAEIRVRVPDGVAAAVRNRTALAGFSIDGERFPKHDGWHRSPGYDVATDRVEIDLDGGVASFAVR